MIVWKTSRRDECVDAIGWWWRPAAGRRHLSRLPIDRALRPSNDGAPGATVTSERPSTDGTRRTHNYNHLRLAFLRRRNTGTHCVFVSQLAGETLETGLLADSLLSSRSIGARNTSRDSTFPAGNPIHVIRSERQHTQ